MFLVYYCTVAISLSKAGPGLVVHPLKGKGVEGGYWVNKKQGAIRESLLYLVDLIRPGPQNWTTPPPLGELVFRSDGAINRLDRTHQKC